MPETKDDIAAERDQLKAENDSLKAENDSLKAAHKDVAELARQGIATLTQQAPAQQTFQLSEAGRQELETYGVTNVNGVMLTIDEVRDKMGDDQSAVEIKDPPEATDRRKWVDQIRRERGAGVYGVDYVYPSVKPGEIDPAVAGTPGINGPAADTTTDGQ